MDKDAEFQGVWSDDGSRGRGVIHSPPYDGPLAVASTYGTGINYLSVQSHAYGYHPDDKRGWLRGNIDGKASIEAGGALSTLDGQIFPNRDAIYDKLHEMGFLVVTTGNGGRYFLVRGDMPPGRVWRDASSVHSTETRVLK